MANILIGGVNLKTLGMHGGVANIKDYGGLSDDTYDNYGVTQALVDAWEALDGGTILFPASREGSRYRFTQGVVNDGAGVVSFSGMGKAPDVTNPHTVLWLDSDTDGAFLIKYAHTATSVGGQIIERLHFMGNNDTDGLGANQSGILFAGRSYNHMIDNCGFRYLSGYAIAHDPTVTQSYNQNSSIRNTHFWNVNGCFGPTVDYPASGNYLFTTLYTIDNVGLDSSVLWPSSGHTVNPYIWDLRACRDVVCLGNFVIEGSGSAGQTACIALACNGKFVFDNIWYEITANGPTYLFAFYGVAGGKFNATGEKIVQIGKAGVLPMWFEDDSSNETIVHVDDWTDYDANTIAEIAVWENGVDVNKSGYIEIDRLNSKQWNEGALDAYAGRLHINHAPMDMQGRYKLPISAPRKLFSWNASQGTPFRDWGEGVLYYDTLTTDAGWAIEDDGDFRCLRITGNSSSDKYPRITWRFGAVGGWGHAEDYQGSVICLAFKYRATIDGADSPKTPNLVVLSPNGWDNAIILNATVDNSTTYETCIAVGTVGPNAGSDQYDFQTRASSSLTVAGVLRILAFEAWLGCPDKFDLEPASKILTYVGLPTFLSGDTTPSVGGCKTWKTHTGALTITDLDDFPVGDEVTIISKGAIVFDTTGTNLVGSSVDITTASGDITRWVSEDGTTKRLMEVQRATGLIVTPATVTAGAGIRLPHGTAPSAPVDGDMWTTSAGLFVRINGSTVGPLS